MLVSNIDSITFVGANEGETSALLAEKVRPLIKGQSPSLKCGKPETCAQQKETE